MPDAAPGKISWIDLTISDAESVKAFYQSVAGWTPEPVDMGGYSDYSMLPPGATEPVAGICHARGCYADFPPQWLIYINVPDLHASLQRCIQLNGEILIPAKPAGTG